MYDLIVQYRKDAQPEPSPRWVSVYSFIIHREWWWIFYFISFMFVHGSSHLWFKFRSSWLRRLSPSHCVINNWSVWWFMFSGTLFMWMHVCLDLVFKQMRSVQWSQTHINISTHISSATFKACFVQCISARHHLETFLLSHFYSV